MNKIKVFEYLVVVGLWATFLLLSSSNIPRSFHECDDFCVVGAAGCLLGLTGATFGLG